MAAREHSSTRRRVLGAVAALPVLALAGLPATVRGQSPSGDSPRPEPQKRGLSPNGDCPRPPTPAHALWDRRLARYRRLHALWKAEAETGAFRAANDAYARARAALIARFGSWEKAKRSRTGKPLCRVAFARVDAAEEVYYERFTAPLDRAIIQLVQTAAPDLRALLAKIEVIREHGLESHDLLRPPIELLREDVQRLEKEWLSRLSKRGTGGGAGSSDKEP